MAEDSGGQFVGSDSGKVEGARRFYHEAMATSFEIIVVHEDGEYARQAARAAFDELDRLEQALSRFIENSDVSRINNLRAGQATVVGPDTFDCLQIARRIYEETEGAFDVTFGSVGSGRRGMEFLKLNEAEHTVEVPAEGVRVDLGGIGKGYALDRMAELLGEWGVGAALLNGGRSTVLAIGSPANTNGWPITISDPFETGRVIARLSLSGEAVSGSGLQAGLHIIDPHTGEPADETFAAWAAASTGAEADALSTAFLVMKPQQVKRYCEHHAGVSALCIQADSDKCIKTMSWFGRWRKEYSS